jgi:hypothetical protein
MIPALIFSVVYWQHPRTCEQSELNINGEFQFNFPLRLSFERSAAPTQGERFESSRASNFANILVAAPEFFMRAHGRTEQANLFGVPQGVLNGPHLSSVGIATSYGLDDRGVGVRVKNFHVSKSSRPALRSTQTPVQWAPRALSPGVKRPGREVDHSRKCGSIHPLPIRLHGVVLN